MHKSVGYENIYDLTRIFFADVASAIFIKSIPENFLLKSDNLICK